MELSSLVPSKESNLTTVQNVQSDNKVEKLLEKTYLKLAESEATTEMFRRMLATGVSTNDVRNFMINQSKSRRMKPGCDNRVMKAAMRSKLSDALSCSNRLRQTKNRLRKDLFKMNKTNTARNMIKIFNAKVKKHKRLCTIKNIRKYELCRAKQSIFNTTSKAPSETMEILEKVNIFESDLCPQDPGGPMICDSNIKLSKDELTLLSRGPRFMMCDKVTKESFCVELEKNDNKADLERSK